MPNHVTNKITFDASYAERVFAGCRINDRFDFNLLIPQPPHMYRGDLSSEDAKDFKCNWDTWNCANWGTKWNAYSCAFDVKDGSATIKFDTAWTVPYPVIVAFANAFNIEFEHRYFDEGQFCWGIEEWTFERGSLRRTKKRGSLEEDKNLLSIELKGFDLDAVENES